MILDFVDTYFGEDDLEAFKKYFELKIKHKKDPLVQAGGLPAMLGCFLKNNKQAYKAFKKHQQGKDEHAKVEDSTIGKKRKRSADKTTEEPAAKRKRVSSVASTEGPVTRRKSHDIAELAQPSAEAPVFKRIDPTKF